MSVDDTFKIEALVVRFANSFDSKGWNFLLDCLADSVYSDYSDLRGTPPETISVEAHVRSRQKSLNNLMPHHLCGNYEIQYLDALQVPTAL